MKLLRFFGHLLAVVFVGGTLAVIAFFVGVYHEANGEDDSEGY